MFKKNLIFISYILVFQFFTSKVCAQIDLESKDHFVWFDAVVGHGNSGIYNGTIFVEQFKTKPNNHRFYLDNRYKLGNLIYDNQTYYNIYLKYDVFEDQLIAKLPYQDNFLFLRLIKEKIDFFELNIDKIDSSTEKHSFVNSKTKPLIVNEDFNGFYQILSKLKIATLLKKNYKETSELIDNNLAYTQFSERSYYALLKDNTYYPINSKKDLVRIFPNQKKYISIFYRRNRKLFKVNETEFYKNLLNDLQLSIEKTAIK